MGTIELRAPTKCFDFRCMGGILVDSLWNLAREGCVKVRDRRVGKVLGILASLLMGASAYGVSPTSLVLFNGKVYTANDKQPTAEAVVAVDGRIAYVGSTEEALKRAPASAKRVDLKGQTVLPGLTDSHAHLADIGFRELDFNLEGTASLADLQARLKARAAQTKAGDWLTGDGWIESRWTPARFPTKEDLDSVVADRAVVLQRADGHSVVANSLALKRAGIDRNTKSPAGGSIIKDPKTGEPTGMLLDNAMGLVKALIPERTEAEVLKALEAGAKRSVALGWTQIQDAGTALRQVELLCRLYAQGRVKLRVYNAIGGAEPELHADAERFVKQGPAARSCDERYVVRGIKLYIDGALGSRGAALLAPYSDAPDSTGLLLNTPETLLPILTTALKNGVQVETHAIGDRGNRIMLDLYEKAFASVPKSERKVAEPRWRLEHAQVFDPKDIPRLAKLGVIASMQPSHAIGDLFFAPARLGPERLKGAYAWRSVLDSKAIIVAGSDAPVEKGDPRIEFYAAVARKSLDGFSGPDWHPEQRVTRQEALKMLTLWPAYAAFQEKERGSLEAGKAADLSVFSADWMLIPEAEILKSRAVLTIIRGEVVHDASPR